MSALRISPFISPPLYRVVPRPSQIAASVRRASAAFVGCALSLLPIHPTRAQRLSPLAAPPDWGRLARFAKTLTAEDAKSLLEGVYAPNGAAGSTVRFERRDGTAVLVAQSSPGAAVVVPLADAPAACVPAPVAWRPLPHPAPDPDCPLAGVRIALDPGHLGGPFARMEERWLQFGDAPPVREGDLTLRVAERLAPALARLGAEVLWVRSTDGPTTPLRPGDLLATAEGILRADGVTPLPNNLVPPRGDPSRERSVAWQADRLFYRVAEIRSRARRVNETLRPDLVICIHFNAEPWGDPRQPDLVDVDHLHLLVNGAYSPGDLAYDDVRFAMLLRLLSGTHPAELGVSEAVARALARATGLPPYRYSSPNALPVGHTPYLWARNLLANRIYECPVIYTEAHVMNGRPFFDRFLAGEYEGWRLFEGAWHEDLYQEYAHGIAEGLRRYCLGQE